MSIVSGLNVVVPVLSGLCLRNGLSSKACKSNAVPGHIATCNSEEQLIADAQFADTLCMPIGMAGLPEARWLLRVSAATE